MALSTGQTILRDIIPITCKDRERHNQAKNVYTLRGTLFKMLEGFKMPVLKNIKQPSLFRF